MIRRMDEGWAGDDYNILRKNCIHFGEAFAARLGVGPVPRWVRKFCDIGCAIDDGLTYLSEQERGCYQRASRWWEYIKSTYHGGVEWVKQYGMQIYHQIPSVSLHTLSAFLLRVYARSRG